MPQLYLLTVLTNILAGSALSAGFIAERFERFSEHTDFMKNPVYRLILGIVTLLIGLINISELAASLIPCLTGIICGVLLICEYLSRRKDLDSVGRLIHIADRIVKTSAPFLTAAGVSAVVTGILHMILPGLPLL